MGSCNGHADIEEAKKVAIEASLKAVQVAKNQQTDLLQKFREIHDYFEAEAYDSQDHWFLEIPQDASEVKQLMEHLKRFSTTVDQIVSEEEYADGYRESFTNAKYQISQLIEYLRQIQLLLALEDEADGAYYPPLPDDLSTDLRSARQTRDYLVIRDYGQLLDLMERVLGEYL